jgi:hypothetical protein
MTTATYSYPVVAAASVPQQKLRHTHFIIAVAVALAVVVVGITALVVGLKPTLQLCHFTCGPDVGPRLLNPTAYANSQFGYRVEYDSSEFSLGGQTAAGVTFTLGTVAEGGGTATFTATAGSDVNAALNSAVNSIPSSTFQDIQEIGPVAGAEIGEVEGVGVAYSATFVPPNGGQSEPVAVVAEAATFKNLTISLLVAGAQDLSQVDNLPIGLDAGQLFDEVGTNTIWPGQA